MAQEKKDEQQERSRRRRVLRQNMTPAEARLWSMLRKRQLRGRRFRRQHSLGPYIVDFCCPEEKLAMELDGDVHRDPARTDYDDARTAELARLGVRVVRFENREVFANPAGVLEAIAWHFHRAGRPPAAGDPKGS